MMRSDTDSHRHWFIGVHKVFGIGLLLTGAVFCYLPSRKASVNAMGIQ